MYCVNCKKAQSCFMEAKSAEPRHYGESRFSNLYFCTAGYHGSIVDPYINRECPHYKERKQKPYVNKFGL